jgi:hypothetical protein
MGSVEIERMSKPRLCRCCGKKFTTPPNEGWRHCCDACIEAWHDGDDFRFQVIAAKQGREVAALKDEVQDDLVPF